MKCDNCRFNWCEGASLDYPYPWTSCSKGHWDGDPSPERPRTPEDEEVDLWADCKDFEPETK